jgi:hypothetical protein
MADPRPGSGEEARAAHEIAFLTERASRDDRPLLVFAFHTQEAERQALVAEMRRALKARDMLVRSLDAGLLVSKRGSDLYREIGGRSAPGGLCVIVDLPRDDKTGLLEQDTLTYLNLHRDRILDDKLRFALLLHTRDAEQVLHLAADLWDFRHATFWLDRSASVLPRRYVSAGREARDVAPMETVLPEEAASHIVDVRELVAETDNSEAKASLLLDLAFWLRRRGASEEALAASVDALETEEGLDEASTATASTLAGDLHVALGNGGEARRLFERGLEIAERLAEQEPNRADFQRDLAIAFERMAKISEAEDKVGWMSRSVEIRERVLAMDRDQAILQRELAVVLAQRETAAEDERDLDRARQLLRALKNRGALEAGFEKLLDWLEAT